MSRRAIWVGAFLGSTIGGCVPSLWHAGLFSLWGIALSTVGGIAGIWVAWRWFR
jgi:hypothetical protein